MTTAGSRGRAAADQKLTIAPAWDQLLLTLFSAGGHDNDDLPLHSSYRAVTPMALTLQYGHGTPTATPWPIAYRTFNYEPHNGLYRPQPLLDFRYA